MKISDLNGTKLKKLIGAKRCAFNYHNKNNSGGNFGLFIRGVNGIDFELSGYYDLTGSLGNLRLGAPYQLGTLIGRKSLQEFIDLIKKISETQKQHEI